MDLFLDGLHMNRLKMMNVGGENGKLKDYGKHITGEGFVLKWFR